MGNKQSNNKNSSSKSPKKITKEEQQKIQQIVKKSRVSKPVKEQHTKKPEQFDSNTPYAEKDNNCLSSVSIEEKYIEKLENQNQPSVSQLPQSKLEIVNEYDNLDWTSPQYKVHVYDDDQAQKSPKIYNMSYRSYPSTLADLSLRKIEDPSMDDPSKYNLSLHDISTPQKNENPFFYEQESQYTNTMNSFKNSAVKIDTKKENLFVNEIPDTGSNFKKNSVDSYSPYSPHGTPGSPLTHVKGRLEYSSSFRTRKSAPFITDENHFKSVSMKNNISTPRRSLFDKSMKDINSDLKENPDKRQKNTMIIEEEESKCEDDFSVSSGSLLNQNTYNTKHYKVGRLNLPDYPIGHEPLTYEKSKFAPNVNSSNKINFQEIDGNVIEKIEEVSQEGSSIDQFDQINPDSEKNLVSQKSTKNEHLKEISYEIKRRLSKLSIGEQTMPFTYEKTHDLGKSMPQNVKRSDPFNEKNLTLSSPTKVRKITNFKNSTKSSDLYNSSNIELSLGKTDTKKTKTWINYKNLMDKKYFKSENQTLISNTLNSKENDNYQAINTYLTEEDDNIDDNDKKIRVFHIDLGDIFPEIHIVSLDDELTVGWLYSEFYRQIETIKHIKDALPKNMDQFLFFQSANTNSTLDLFQTQFSRKISNIPDNLWLKPVYKQPVPSDGFLGADHFLILKKIGCGGFGDVYLVRRKDTGYLYAMKIIQKEGIDKIHARILKRELKIFKDMDHPFVIKLYYSFQTNTSYNFVMEYCPGRDLFKILLEKKKLPESTAQLYFSELLLALDYQHKNLIIYRDLKLENVLLGVDGHIKLIDFGLSKKLKYEGAMTDSFCGSPLYIAPEILDKAKYNHRIDYFSLGVLLYELQCGFPPFTHADTIFKETRPKFIYVKYPNELSTGVCEMIDDMLVTDPKERITNCDHYFDKMFELGYDTRFLVNKYKNIKGPIVPDVMKKERYYEENHKIENKLKWVKKQLSYSRQIKLTKIIATQDKIFYFRRSIRINSPINGYKTIERKIFDNSKKKIDINELEIKKQHKKFASKNYGLKTSHIGGDLDGLDFNLENLQIKDVNKPSSFEANYFK